MKYLILAKDEISNYVEGRALKSKSMTVVCQFILKDILHHYGSIKKMRGDYSELDGIEAYNLFTRYEI